MRHVLILGSLFLFAACAGHPDSEEGTLVIQFAGTGTGSVQFVNDDQVGNCAAPDTCERGLANGSVGITLTATASPGSHFVTWNADCGDADPVTELSAAQGDLVTCTARFDLDPPAPTEPPFGVQITEGCRLGRDAGTGAFACLPNSPATFYLFSLPALDDPSLEPVGPNCVASTDLPPSVDGGTIDIATSQVSFTLVYDATNRDYSASFPTPPWFAPGGDTLTVMPAAIGSSFSVSVPGGDPAVDGDGTNLYTTVTTNEVYRNFFATSSTGGFVVVDCWQAHDPTDSAPVPLIESGSPEHQYFVDHGLEVVDVAFGAIDTVTAEDWAGATRRIAAGRIGFFSGDDARAGGAPLP